MQGFKKICDLLFTCARIILVSEIIYIIFAVEILDCPAFHLREILIVDAVNFR